MQEYYEKIILLPIEMNLMFNFFTLLRNKDLKIYIDNNQRDRQILQSPLRLANSLREYLYSLFYILPTVSFLLFLTTKTPYQSKGKGFEVAIRETGFPKKQPAQFILHISELLSGRLNSVELFGQDLILQLSIYSLESNLLHSRYWVPNPSIIVQNPVPSATGNRCHLSNENHIFKGKR